MQRIEEIPVIACSADNKFIEPLLVMLKSIEIKTKCGQIFVYILSNNLSTINIESIINNFRYSCLKISIININNNDLSEMKTNEAIPVTSYYRLFLADVLPTGISKVIYLDCDVIVQVDIMKLWIKSVEGVALLAVTETDKRTCCVSAQDGLKTYKDLGIPPETKYFNAGVLVINLEYWRKNDIKNKILHYIIQHYDKVLWHDQDGLNAILWNNWREIEPGWNVITHIYNCRDYRDSTLDEMTFNNIMKYPYIVHFCDLPKPWEKNSNHKTKNEYYKYLNMLIK